MPVIQAHSKLYPPQSPSTSSVSPVINNPCSFFDCIVFKSISSIGTPPVHTCALSKEFVPVIFNLNFTIFWAILFFWLSVKLSHFSHGFIFDNFNKIFTNDLSGSTTKNIKKKEDNKDVVYTLKTANQKETNKYNISATIPKINIDADYADKINAQIKANYADKIENIIEGKNENETDYSVTYKAYLNGDLLSLIIKETIREGKNTQAVKIKTYNYNLNNNTEVSILDLVDAKGYTQKNLQKEIDAELKDLEKKDEELKNQFSDVRLRDLSSNIYKLENTENFIVNENGFLYIIYAYGNTENTNKMDIIIFE